MRDRKSTKSRRNVGFSGLSAVKPCVGMAAPHISMAPSRPADFVAWNRSRCSANERPVRGDNRTGQAIWARGVDGRSRRIQPRWGGITAPTHIGRRRAAARSNRLAIFLTFLAGIGGIFGENSGPAIYCAAARLVSPAAGFSDAMVAAGWSSARAAGTSGAALTFSAAGRPGTTATGSAGVGVTAKTAA
jgi:hypothetical protein